MGQAVNHDRVLPICFDHHQSEEAGCISLHGSPKEFVELHGTELELEEKLRNKLSERNY